jgi:tRNA(fMet)-specific endonuclease VapC
MLDTDTCSYSIGRHGARLTDRFQAHASEIVVSTITRFELLRGVERRPEAVALAANVEAFLARVVTLPFDEAAAASAARLDGWLHRAGTPIGGLDTLIAGHALAVGAVVVTNNERHFGRVPGLAMENWLA